MKKIIDLKINRDTVSVFNGRVHVGDTNVVELNGQFLHDFSDNLDNVNVDVIALLPNGILIQSGVIKENKFKVVLNNELFKIKGSVKCELKLHKEAEILYINDAFVIHIVESNVSKEFAESFTIAVEKLDKMILDSIEENKETILTKVSEVFEKKSETILNENEEKIKQATDLKIKEIKEERVKHNFILELDNDGNLYMITNEEVL